VDIHEYQAKELLSECGVGIAPGGLAYSPEQAVYRAKEIGGHKWVVKAQIHSGARGKAGGIKICSNDEEIWDAADELLGKRLVTHQTGPAGKVVYRLYIEQATDIEREFYLALVLDRDKQRVVFVTSTEGGMDIEDVAANTPEKIIKEWIDPGQGLRPFQARKIAYKLGLEGKVAREMSKFIHSLYTAYISSDASLFEINPVLKTSDNNILAVDAKMTLDDNALYRHPELADMRDITEEDPLELEAGEAGLNYVKLDGNVGCMVNGAGLAMATMDIIKLSGGEPANFLDVGGGANAKTVEAGFRIIMKDPNVQAILINIFGGIVRCDRVAHGVVEAYNNIDNIDIPIIVRLQGTNAEEGAKIIDESGLEVKSAVLLKDAADLVKEVVA